ncbi:hypothetical protein C8J56DRAFT_814955 [Mycena floridula]|nr:hypothetical protein C8J56DRAFT_814955 [Mycena floridula]
MAAVTESLSEQLIAQLLQEDLAMLEQVREVERQQLDHILALSAKPSGRIPKLSSSVAHPTDADEELALRQALCNNDAALALSLHATLVADQQYAQRLAAAESKYMVDLEFARQLQAQEDVRMDMDAESILGRETVEHIIASNPNVKGKGKSKAAAAISDKKEKFNGPYQKCGICLEPFQVTNNPVRAAVSANVSARIPFGLCLPCPKEHSYCVDCLSTYIQSKIDPNGKGEGSLAAVVFPIPCPECKLLDWPKGIEVDVAERVLTEKGMISWHQQKLLDTLPRLFCPYSDCSTLVQAHEDPDEPQAQCPSCNRLMCVPCRVIWHKGLNCEQYQALPLDERSPADRLLLELAQAKNWRRCPKCSVIVELTFGCNHVICRLCGCHFCFKCGALSDEAGKCSRVPSCELWDEDRLLAENNRENRPAAHLDAPPPPPYQPQGHIFIPDFPRARNDFDLDWMTDPDIVSTRHWFTATMIRNLQCGYCNTSLNSMADLRYHLSHVMRHSVFACCGRFFRNAADFRRHGDSYPSRFGEHSYQIENPR